jgi:large subunit ribosomal protein L14e
VVGKTIKNRRCNIKHLEPVDQVIEIKSDDVEAVKKDLESILA